MFVIRVHWFCGNAAHILSIVTIFTSVKLEKAELHQDIFDIVLVSYVVIHVIAHLLLSVSITKSCRQLAIDLCNYNIPLPFMFVVVFSYWDV